MNQDQTTKESPGQRAYPIGGSAKQPVTWANIDRFVVTCIDNYTVRYSVRYTDDLTEIGFCIVRRIPNKGTLPTMNESRPLTGTAAQLMRYMRDNAELHMDTRKVARKYQVSRITANRALSTLEMTGHIHRLPFVNAYGGYVYTWGKADLTAKEYTRETDDPNVFWFNAGEMHRDEILQIIQEILDDPNTPPVTRGIYTVIKGQLENAKPTMSRETLLMQARTFHSIAQTFESIAATLNVTGG